MNVLESLRQSAQRRRRRVLFPEGQDPRVIEAANTFQREDLGQAIVVDPPAGSALDKRIEIVDGQDRARLERCIAKLVERRGAKGMTRDRAAEAVTDRLMYGALLVGLGDADASVAGSVSATASVLRAAIYSVGTAPGYSLVSSCFLMQLADRCVTFADCAVVPNPSAEQLSQIATCSADSHARLTGQTPRVAMLSFSTKGSATHADIDKVIEATRLAQAARPDLSIDGELQFDAAFVPSIGTRKAPQSAVAGQANVFVFPDLGAGNIGYKIAERIGGATAVGPLIQGLSKPCMDLSRGCKPSDIVDVAVIASILS